MLGSIGPHHPEPAFSTVAHDAHRGAHVDDPGAIRRNLYVGRVLDLKDVEIREWGVLRGGRDGRQERDRASGDEDADHWCLPCEVAPKVQGVARLREAGRATGGCVNRAPPFRPRLHRLHDESGHGVEIRPLEIATVGGDRPPSHLTPDRGGQRSHQLGNRRDLVGAELGLAVSHPGEPRGVEQLVQHRRLETGACGG